MMLVTGASGQLGGAVCRLLAARGVAFAAVTRPEFDFRRPETVAACFHAARPSLVINAAAYTAVDDAETDDAADAANHAGPLLLARLCEAADIPLIHVSTDYVFDGHKGAPYLETDATAPTGRYGLSKRRGEAAVLATGARAVILRTAWLYSATGRNFARAMLEAGRRGRVRVVADQRGAPTAAGDLAAAILEVADRIARWRPEYGGIFHATCQGEASWFEFATAIFEQAARHGYKAPELWPISSAEWPAAAKRPADSRLDCTKLARIFGVALPDWRHSLPGVVAALCAA